MDFLPLLQNVSSPWQIIGAICIALSLNSLIQWLLRPKNLPPFYFEFPYIPWLGSLPQFATQPREFLERAATKCGNVFTIQLFGKKMTFLFGKEGHAHFFRAKESVFDIREAYAMTVTTFGPGVCYDCTQSRMAEQFAFFKNGLSDESFVTFLDLIQDEVSSFFEREWGEEGTADLLQTLSAVFTLTSSRCLLGEEIRKRWNDSGMAEHYLALDHSFVPILFFFPWIPNPHRTKCIHARKLFEKIFMEVIEERQMNKDTTVPPSDLLQDLINATYKDGTKPTISEITGILIGVLLGGQHTSNVTGTWILIHLLKDPIWMKKIMDEQEKLFSGSSNDDASLSLLHPSKLTYNQVKNDMPIFEQVMSETLRLHHPFFQLSRSVKKDSIFNGKIIPKGHFVNVAPSAAMRLMWGKDDGSKFDPSRFGPNAPELEPYTWIPFGGGMHQCGGRKFAWNSLKASLSWMLRNYDIELIGKGATELPREDYTTMVVAPTKAHVQVKYRRRRRK